MRQAVLAVVAVLTLLDRPAPSQPAFRTGTTVVEVSAVITQGGRPVTDLRADEITVKVARDGVDVRSRQKYAPASGS